MPSLIAGQAFGRIGCFMFGCCYGKMCDLPWAVHFPHGAPAWQAQVADGVIGEHAAFSAGVHPTQIYALIAGALTAAFLYAWWPRRRYDGQILALSLIMAGVSRFFEQMLRDDEPAALASVPSMTVANWLAIVVVVAGAGLLLYFRRRGKLHTVTERGG
jgi:phosphatidylglycerol:prolipoprotein diacylglycerol transferase